MEFIHECLWYLNQYFNEPQIWTTKKILDSFDILQLQIQIPQNHLVFILQLLFPCSRSSIYPLVFLCRRLLSRVSVTDSKVGFLSAALARHRINVSHMAICCCHAWSQMRMIRPFWKARSTFAGLSIDKLTKQLLKLCLFVSWTKLEKNDSQDFNI